ncbi:phage distal tail protein [Streptomyces sp. NPDC048434]|uniref:phage distal tail protein n=1 Tax=Streptomyces sp. NPDC048434 TaxID=3365549 RepID=UPI0037218981
MPYTAGDTLDGLRADLGTIPLGGVDGSGVAWSLQSMEGWDGSESRSEMQQREGDHGAWQGPVYLGERPITLAGTITAPDRGVLDDAMERIRAAAALTPTLLVVQESRPKQCVVKRSGKPLIQYTTDRIASYSVMVTAEDPRRYSTDLQQGTTALPSTTGGLTLPYTLPYTISATTVAGQVDAYNEGSIDTRPVLTITGPVSQPRVYGQMPDGSVRVIRITFDLLDGDVLAIDTDMHTAVLNGNVSRRRFVSAPQGWPTIPDGGAVSYQFRSAVYSATALLTVQWRSAWM